MARVRVKICGITRVEDALLVAEAGVDAIGLVFHEKSPRYVSIEQAQKICQALPAFISVVALFKDESDAQVRHVEQTLAIDVLQFHGLETADFCRQFQRPYIKALGVAGVDDLISMAQPYDDAQAILLDAHAAGEQGGSGQVFDWHKIPSEWKDKIILAGGLTPTNIAQAMKVASPYALDLSSGVESSPGCKDTVKVHALMQQIKGVNCECND